MLVAEEHVELDGGRQQELIEQGPGNTIGLGDLRHFAVDALIEPSQHDHVDTRLRSSIGASDTLHSVASGGGDGDDPMDLMCHHHLTPTRGGMETVNRNLNGLGDSHMFLMFLRSYKRQEIERTHL